MLAISSLLCANIHSNSIEAQISHNPIMRTAEVEAIKPAAEDVLTVMEDLEEEHTKRERIRASMIALKRVSDKLLMQYNR